MYLRFFISPVIFILIVLFSLPLNAQLSQSVHGQLLQELGGGPVSGAVVLLENREHRYNTLSDEAGRFEFAEVQPGTYRFMVQHLNFAPYREPELLVEASKSVYRRVLLLETVQALEAVEIKSAPLPPNLQRREFTVAQTQRYPATFFDPARLVLSQPGIAQANDQANHVVVHGLSPLGIQWRLEELPILNPNHLGNAGTRRDRASASGGGVNMISGQLMANSSFNTGALAPRFGNATTGVFDIRLRPGNMQEREHTLQASLLGIDLATEGPLAKGTSSYLVNYRYSTVGLLSQLGVDFGGEAIHYQDLSANLVFEETPLGRISLFLLGGSSSNKRTPLDEADWEQDKDRQQIDYRSGLAAAGLTQSISLGRQYRWQNGLSFSAMRNERTERWTGPRLPNTTNFNDSHDAQQLSAFTRLHHSLSSRINTELGLQFIGHWARAIANPFIQEGSPLDEHLSYTLTQPYLQANFGLIPQIELQAGLRLSHLSWRNHTQLEPFGQLIWLPSEQQRLHLSYGRQSQVYNDLLLAQRAELPAQLNGLINSQYLGLGWGYRLREHTSLSAELFYQYLNQLPGNANDLAWNYLSEPYIDLSGSGSARSYGVDLQLRRDVFNGWYYELSGSIFNASYRGTDGVDRPSPFNSRWSATYTRGKEWTKVKAGGERTWALNLRLHTRGGYWYTPINETESTSQNTEIEDAANPHSARFPRYASSDLRLSHTRQKKGYTRIWSIDIQNLGNRRNPGWYYYDFLQQKIDLQEQLGIIPVLAYRIQF